MRFRRVGAGRFAVESAFAEHLRTLRRMLAPSFDRVAVAGPSMSAAQYARESAHLGHVDEERERIRYVELHPGEARTPAFWLRHFLPAMRTLLREARRADLVHSGTTHNLSRPIELPALLFAMLARKKTVCVVDMDLRRDARMNHATGRWSARTRFLCERVYDPIRNAQLAFAARRCSLVLLKGRSLCRDFGKGRWNVRYFLDAAFSAEHLIASEALEAKLASLDDARAPLELVYFGRLTAYKGVDRCIEAVAKAARSSPVPLRLHVIGAGEEAKRLRELAAERSRELETERSRELETERSRDLAIGRASPRAEFVFHGALPFGPKLFDALRPMHLLLAAPLSEDTPRSALDAMASGIPILAFDTEYYADLAASGAVETVAWPSVDAMADAIARYANDKRALAPRMRAAVEFARANTQEAWLAARVAWTRELFRDERPADVRAGTTRTA